MNTNFKNSSMSDNEQFLNAFTVDFKAFIIEA